MGWLSILAVVVVGFLGWNLYRRFGADRIADLVERRRTTSQIAGRGELVDGNRHLDVALALTPSTLFYENSDMEASLDLQYVHEVEYGHELVTGLSVARGQVLRLRCYSKTFEFVLPDDVTARWRTLLPPRSTPLAPQAVTA